MDLPLDLPKHAYLDVTLLLSKHMPVPRSPMEFLSILAMLFATFVLPMQVSHRVVVPMNMIDVSRIDTDKHFPY